MIRLWCQVGFRAAAVGVLVVGLAAGVQLGRDRAARQIAAGSSDAVRVEIDDMQLLKRHQGEHAVARAWQRRAEGVAARKAAVEVRAAATRARKLETAKQAAADRKTQEQTGGPIPYNGPIPDSCDEYSGSRATGCALTLDAGFELDQFPCLDKLWKHESGWNYKAENPSGAYGIPQALPGSKMSSAGADWKTNPATQIKWGLGYIEGRYKTPCGAWSHFQSAGSY